MIEAGQPAPTFALPDQGGDVHDLASLRGTPVVVYFYPKDDTPGCTKEACQFRDLRADFEAAGARVFGISPDPVSKHAKFAEKYGLTFPLLADERHDDVPPTCAAYGVWQEKRNYGRSYMGVVRTTYLIDADGKVARRWDEVKVAGHADEVLEAVREMTA